MATTSKTVLTVQSRPQQLPSSLLLVMLWCGVLGVLCFYAASQIAQVRDFFNLGNVANLFFALVVGLAGTLSVVSIPLIYRANNNGRFIAMVLNFAGLVFAVLYLGHLLGLYVGVDNLADGLTRNTGWLYAIAGGYLTVWLGGRFRANSQANVVLTRAGLAVMMVSLVLLLLASGLLDSIGSLVQAVTRPDILLTVVFIVVFGAVSLVLLRHGAHFGETIAQRETWQGWLFLMPNFINFALFFAFPLLLSLYLSFTNYDAVSQARFIGLDNYGQLLSLEFKTASPAGEVVTFSTNHFEIARITLGGSALVIGARDPLFWSSLANTFRYCIILIVLSIFPALGLAMLLNSKMPGMKFYRAVFFIPSIAAVVGVSLIWKWLYDPTIGTINYTISQIVSGLNSTLGTQITDPKLNWLTDDNLLLISVVIMAAWQVVGFNTVIFLAGLQGVPKELMEAATVDGAGRFTRFRKITMPMIAPTTFFVTVTTLIAGLQVFSEVFVLVGNSTSNAKLTTVYYLYQQGFQLFKMGYASATAWVLFIVIFVVTLLQFRVSQRNQAYAD